jgi:hypothetical protein
MIRCEVLSRVRSLVQTESSMRRQITDLEKKEQVYTKTIQVPYRCNYAL